MKNTIIISAFPCSGKSYCFNHYQNDYSILDSDSSNFSWEKDDNGKNTKIRDPNFPANYMAHINDNIGKVDFIFVSSHEEVRKVLINKGIRYLLVYPELKCKQEYLHRAKERGSSEGFVKMLENNWLDFYTSIRNEQGNNLVIKQELGSNEFIDKRMLDTLYNNSKWFSCNYNKEK